MLNPSVDFAVNDRITLTTGLQWQQRQATNLDIKLKILSAQALTWCSVLATVSHRATRLV